MQAVIRRLERQEATIGIVGLGYVGLPLAIRYTEVGYHVLGFEIDAAKRDALLAGQSYMHHIPDADIDAMLPRFDVTDDWCRAAEVDTLILCVPTPLNVYREPDLSYVIHTMESLVPHLRAGQVISLESTTYPGTTTEELAPRIEAQGWVLGRDIFLIYSPEREDPGNESFRTQDIPKVLGGHTAACAEVGAALYGQVIDELVPVSSTQAAEMTKLLENIHRSVNIGLMNEMKIVADRMGIDIHEVIRAAATKPFGFTPYFPGPGIGGHCIPVDPFYLTWKARAYGLHTRFIELAGEVNRYMPQFVLGKVIHALNSVEKAVKGSVVLVLGVGYKADTEDVRESPSIDIMDLLIQAGARVVFADPFWRQLPPIRSFDHEVSSVELTPETLSELDCVVLATAHSAFDYEMIRQHARLIVDTRGIYHTDSAEHIIHA